MFAPLAAGGVGGPPNVAGVSANGAVEHRHLRSAIEFAVAIAEAGQRLRPPIPFPAELKPYLKAPRLPAGALGGLRRAIEADERFRHRLAAGAVDELVDPIGREWLAATPGWEERAAALARADDERAADRDLERALRRADKRRVAAEQATARTRAELVAAGERIAELTRQLDEAHSHRGSVTADRAAQRDELAAARTAARHADDRAQADRDRLAATQRELTAAREAATVAAAQRDALLAERAERAGVAVGVGALDEVRMLAEAARRVAAGLDALVATPEAPARRPLALPGGTARDSVRAAEFLVRAGGIVVVDGYNVAKLAWPDETLARQRQRLLDAADDLARRFGTELVVVFDGADVVGAHGGQRRLTRVCYSPAGVTADDVIRAEVVAAPVSRAVVVVTNDQAVRRDVAAAGANVVSSDAFLALARR